MAIKKGTLKAVNDAELLSYIINVTPELREEIDLPVQGESIAPIGKIIINNSRYRNAFINTINLIGLTVIKRNGWDNPWSFTKRGNLRFGQQIRELVLDLCNVYDYNANFSDKDRFLETVVPNVLNYLHEVNFQKFYQTTTSDSQLAMAFDTEGGLYEFIDASIGMLFESLKYDTYLVDKYQLCRRIVDGTVTSVKISNYATLTPRQRVAFMKNYSNKMTFRSPNYNPAGVRKATRFEDQMLIMNTEFESDMSTDVLATSYFRNEAEFRTNMALIDSFSDTDSARLTELLGNDYIPFTDDEKTALAKVPAVIISREWFMDYDYLLDAGSNMKQTEFYNPTTLENNHFLHAWRVFSTSPFENAVVFTSDTPAVSSVNVSPESATIYKGQKLQLSASVETTGFANKSVLWSIDESSESKGASINQMGVLSVPANYPTVAGVQGVYTLAISTALASGEELIVAGVTYTPAEADTTANAQATALKTALEADEDVNATYTITRNNGTLTFTEKSGHYGAGAPEVDDSDLVTGVVAEETTTAGVTPSSPITVTATSIYDSNESDTASITVA
ncbi:MAG: Ig-like domain-containing protein [Methanobrevibacter sp.]|nr:Ig-like domain-containing protein [Methanobrevibacter sp.]